MAALARAYLSLKDQVQLVGDRVWSSRSGPGDPDLSSVRAYCMFVGYPRSAHTLVGSLLNAHPSMVLSHELNALRYVRAGFSRPQLFRLILRQDQAFTAAGSTWSGYDYSVPGQWQGRYARLDVIGDKKAAGSSLLIRRDPSILQRLQDLVRVPVRVIHVVRNPFDNIATMLRRGRGGLTPTINSYFRLCEAPVIARSRLSSDNFVTVRHEHFLGDPRGALAKLCRFLGVDPPADFLHAAAQRVLPSPRRSRHQASWTPEAIRNVEQRMTSFDFLAGYSYDQ